jgi:glutathione synthase/RimK-type ligase-like ATP-grasp enzyme
MNGMKYTFLMGVNDSKTAAVVGASPTGKPIYGWEGNTNFHNYTAAPPQNKFSLPVIWFEQKDRKIAKPDIFINCIADADIMTKSLERAIALIDGAQKLWPDVPVFNDPRKIAGTRRDVIYQKFHTLPGIVVPKVLRFIPKSVADVMATAKKEGFAFPYIVRPCGTHQGRGVVLVRSAADAELLESLAFDGSYFYLTQFTDFKDADGLYIKTRFVIIGGQMYPRHAIISKQWKIHAATRDELLKDSPGFRAQEQKLLSSVVSRISPVARESIYKIYDTVGLDYLGFDCCIRPDGQVLFFEINPAQDAMAPSDYKVYPYLQPYGDVMIGGYNATLRQKTSLRKAA